MKKILFLLAAVSLTLTSCMKEDETYKQLKPVIPGLNIYNGLMTQQRIAMQPIDNVIRLGMLFAEGNLQEKTSIEELRAMTVAYGEGKKVNVFGELFQTKTTISKTPEGDYEMKLEPESIGYGACEGTITIQTNGAALLEKTTSENRWFVTLPSDFKVLAAADNASGYQEVMLGGSFSIFKVDDYYKIQFLGMKAYLKATSSIASNWDGAFELSPPKNGESLAFSACMGKKFGFEGRAEGPTCITFDGRTGASMSYQVESGIYKSSLQCLDGVETAKLTGIGDYDTAQYPSPEVKITWVLSDDERSLTKTIDYNGYSVTL